VLARRLLIALAVLMALTALAASVAPHKTSLQQDAARTPPAAAAEPAPKPVEETLDTAAQGQRVAAKIGQSVTIVVRSQDVESVELAEYGTETAEPDSPARFELLADAPGSYPIELVESGRRIGVLEIRG
jgi:hypothetical protein